MCKEVDKLAELYDKFPEVPHFSDLLLGKMNDVFEYKTSELGKFTSRALKDSPEISIAESFLRKGSKVEFHQHEKSYEILIILEGEMRVEFADRIKTLKKYKYVIIEEGQPHAAEVTEDTKFIALTVPRDDGFPTK
jgi:quercetin dioxygenase-like cupin family protein